MTTLSELKIKYQQELRTKEQEQQAKEQAREDHRAEVLAEMFPRVCNYLAEREGVEESELIRYGRLDGDWYSSGELISVTFYLNVPMYDEIFIRLATKLEDNKNRDWAADRHNKCHKLGEALVIAGANFKRGIEREIQEAEDERQCQEREAAKREQEAQVELERQALFDEIANNPLAVSLLKLFIQIQKNAEVVDRHIEQLEEANNNAEYWHSTEVGRLRQQVQQREREANEAADRAQSLEYQVGDLEADLKKARKR